MKVKERDPFMDDDSPRGSLAQKKETRETYLK